MADEMFSDYLVFVDESGDHSMASIDPGYPLFVLSFCIVHKEHYNQTLTPAIRDIKCRYFGHDLVILHERELRRGIGSFALINAAKRTDMMVDLSKAIRDAEITIIGVVIDKLAHAERYHQPEHPYHLAFQFGLERVHRFLQQRGQGNNLTYIICEARGEKEDNELELEFRRVCARGNWGRDVMPFDILIKPKAANSEGLQLADLTARPIGIHQLHPEQPNHAFDVIEQKFHRGDGGEYRGVGLKVFP